MSEEEQKLGATGEFPDGKMNEQDEGELAFAMGVTQGGEVFMDFGTQVHWVAFPPEQALDIANMLRLNARKALKVQEVGQQPQGGNNGGELLKP
jgi:hypothetical protein